MPTKVVFRKFKDGDVIALFPRIPADISGYHCESYMHIGQHGAADPAIVTRTKPATKTEYTPLLKELRSIGYRDLVIAMKITYADFKARKAELKMTSLCGCRSR